MTNPTLVDALEICLQSMEQGADLESCLVLFPGLAKELRPILTAAVRARSISANTVPVEVVRRGRARLLQAAAEMREQKKGAAGMPVLLGKPSRRNSFFGSRLVRLAFSSLAMIAFLLTGGTGLVNASSASIPGDNLYPVKRSWEGVRLVFVFDKNARKELEEQFDHERLQEIEELYTEKRIAGVNFQGVVTQMNEKIWVVDGLNISIEHNTQFTTDIRPGASVQIVGETDDGHIKAQNIILLATPGFTPVFSSTPSSTPTLTPSPSETLGSDDNESETNNWSTLTPNPTDGSGESYAGQATSTKRPDDGESNKNYTTATPGGYPGDGESEHHATSTPSSNEEHHRATRTPTPTKKSH